MSVDPPKKEDVNKPSVQALTFSYRDYSGMKGASGRTHIVQGDNQSAPNISIYSEDNIYLNAAAQIQISSAVLHQSTSNRVIQYIKDEEIHISGEVYKHIEGPVTTTINTNQTEEVVGKHLLNIAGEQETYLHSGQLIEVTGDQTIKISGAQSVTANKSITEQSGKASMGLTAGSSSTLSYDGNEIKIDKDGISETSGNSTVALKKSGSATFGVAGNTVEIKKDGTITIKGGDISIEGGNVKINGGTIKVTGTVKMN